MTETDRKITQLATRILFRPLSDRKYTFRFVIHKNNDPKIKFLPFEFFSAYGGS